MHRHLEADHDKLPLVVPILFIRARPHLIRSQCAGLICFTPGAGATRLQQPFPAGGYHHHPDDEIMHHRRIAILELLQKQFASAT